MRRLVGLPVAVLLTMVLVVPALASRPEMVNFADDDVADGDLFTELCGFEITADSEGHVVFHNAKQGANDAISNWNIRIRLESDSGAYYLVDAGPDMFHRRAGTEYLTVTGRSLTGSFAIGRVEVNLDTGETTLHGQEVGTDLNWICGELD
jgi:hypothetical protein